MRRLVLGLLCLGLLSCTGSSTAAGPPPTPVPPSPTPAPTSRPVLSLAPTPRPAPSPSPLASPSPSLQRTFTYDAIGASDTVGVGASDPARDGWVPQLAQRLGPKVTVHNLGSSGTLIHAALQDQLPRAVADQPDLVTVWLAVNDINAKVPLDQYARDLNSMLDALSTKTHARVLVANVPDLTLVPVYHDVPADALTAEVQQWNAAIADAVARHHALLVDLYQAYAELAANPSYLSSDGFHPSSAGYARVADLFYAAIEQAGLPNRP